MDIKSTSNIDKKLLINIKSNFILKQVFKNLKENKMLKVIKYNKSIQNKLSIEIKDFKGFKNIILEIIPKIIEDKNIFINISEYNKSYYHIYINDSKEENRKNYFTKDEKVEKIKIIIEPEINSFSWLFSGCRCIEKINFIKFNRTNIEGMIRIFYECSSLKELICRKCSINVFLYQN